MVDAMAAAVELGVEREADGAGPWIDPPQPATATATRSRTARRRMGDIWMEYRIGTRADGTAGDEKDRVSSDTAAPRIRVWSVIWRELGGLGQGVVG